MESILPFNKTGEHSYNRRAMSHNYKAPFIYHIIIKKNIGMAAFGMVKGDARIQCGKKGCAYIEESKLGKTIAKSILNIQQEFPILQVYQFCIMPDHVHILLRVKEWSDKHLDFYIECLKCRVATRYSTATNTNIEKDELFEAGYCDKPLLINRSLDGLFRYIRENPHRLAMRQQYPQFFKRVRKLKIGDQEFDAYGNLFLFRNPDKWAVKISRAFSAEEREQMKTAWLSAASKGAVLVSPFIAKAEKEIRAEAEALGARIILITHEALSERFKPSAHDFTLCAEGRLLIISFSLPAKTNLSRSVCLDMNNLAQIIADSY